ncbi:hypothetical protein [Streptomyces sp. NPDC002845]
MIEIEKFRLKTEVKALDAELRLRTLRPGDVPADWADRDDAYAYRYKTRPAGIGVLPETEDGRLAGRFTRAEPGLKVTQSCDEAKENNKGYTELFVQFHVGKRGARMSNMWIDYLADGRSYTLDLAWDAIACGDAIPLVDGYDFCEGTAED